MMKKGEVFRILGSSMISLLFTKYSMTIVAGHITYDNKGVHLVQSAQFSLDLALKQWLAMNIT